MGKAKQQHLFVFCKKSTNSPVRTGAAKASKQLQVKLVRTQHAVVGHVYLFCISGKGKQYETNKSNGG